MPLSSYALQLSEATGHPMAANSRAVAELASDVARELDFEEQALQQLEIAALMHEIGKLALMEEVLYKPGGLTEAELELIRQHPLRGEAMLARAGEPFREVASVVRSCQERWDGGGYPDGLVGEDIPMPSRIIFCCAAYEAMTSERPYSRALSHTMAIGELWVSSGSQFDPEVVAALVRTVSRRAADTPATMPVGSGQADRGRSETRLRDAAGGAR